MKKSAYILNATDRQIERLIQVGVGTFLVPCYNMPPAPVHKRYPTWDRSIEIFEKYHGVADIILVPLWFQSWYHLPTGQCFVDHRRRVWKRIPCLTSKTYLDSRFNPIEELWDASLIDGVAMDLEDYGGRDFFSCDARPVCMCHRCQELRNNGIDTTRLIRSRWRLRCGVYASSGFLPYSASWVTSLFPPSARWYCERTYKKNKYWNLFQKKSNGLSSRAAAGVWLEKHRPDKLKRYVKDVLDKKPWGCGYPFDEGVWFYTHRWHNGRDIKEYYDAIKSI